MTSNGSGMADTSLTALAFTNRRAGVERLPGQPPERGSASLIGLALCAFVVIATLVTADVGALAFARARAQTAGTPPGLSGLGSPAERASAVAAGNGADMLACSCGPLEATISVGVRARLIPFGATVQVRAYARAVLRSSMAPTTSVPPAATPHSSGIAGRAETSARGPATLRAGLPRRAAGLAPSGEVGARPRRPRSVNGRSQRVRGLPVRLVEKAAPGARVGSGRSGSLVAAIGVPVRGNPPRDLRGLSGALRAGHVAEAAGAAVTVDLVTQVGVLALQLSDATLHVPVDRAALPAPEATVLGRAPSEEEQRREDESGCGGDHQELALGEA